MHESEMREMREMIGNIYKRRNELDKETNGQPIEVLDFFQHLLVTKTKEHLAELERIHGYALPISIQNELFEKAAAHPASQLAKSIRQEYVNERMAAKNGWGLGPISALEKSLEHHRNSVKGTQSTKIKYAAQRLKLVEYAKAEWQETPNMGMSKMINYIRSRMRISEKYARKYINQAEKDGLLIVPPAARKSGRPKL